MKPLDFSTPTPHSIRIVRSFAAPVTLVWRAHVEPDLVKRWMTGPPGHSLPVCEIDFRVGGTARYVWKNADVEMGMTAEFLEIVEHERIVHREEYEGWPEGSSTVNSTFEASDGGTTVTIHIEYGSQDARDAVLESGFDQGYAASFANLDELAKEWVD